MGNRSIRQPQIQISKARLRLALLLIPLLTACGSQMQTKEYQAISTAAPGVETPENTYVVSYSPQNSPLYRGDVSTEQVEVKIDSETKTINIKGLVKLADSKSHKTKQAPFELSGQYNQQGEATLTPVTKESGTADMKVRSKVTCLDAEDNSCTQIVADIFVQDVETKTYHVTQVESKSKLAKPVEPTSTPIPEKDPKTAPVSSPQKDPKPNPKTPTVGSPGQQLPPVPTIAATPTPIPKASENLQNGSNSAATASDENDGYDGTPDLYVGHIYTNFEELFSDSYKATSNDSSALDPSRPKDQAIRDPGNGILINGTNLKLRMDELLSDKSQDNDPYIMLPNISRQRYFGTYELVELIINMGFLTKKMSLGYKLQVDDMSQKNGGPLVGSGHKSHQNGLDVDIGYFIKDPKNDFGFPNLVQRGGLRSDFLSKETIHFFQSVMKDSKGAVDRIFVGPNVKDGLCKKAVELGLLSSNFKTGEAVEVFRRLIRWAGHDDHFHMRIKCSKYQRKCRQMTEPQMGSGC